MKKNLLLLSFFTATFSFAQNCSQLFISEYVEGSGNNKALETSRNCILEMINY